MGAIRQLAIAFTLVAVFAGSASAVTIRDLIRLKTAGLTDDVLIALIESDGSVFRLTADDVVRLRDQGLSDKVIVAMLLTAKRATPPALVEAQPIQPVEPAPPPAPVVHVTQTVTQHVEVPRTEIVHVPVAVAVPVFVPHRSIVTRPVEPVFWGWGGQRRPDSWREPEKKEPPAKKPEIKK